MSQASRRVVAVVAGSDSQLLDIAGPVEIFSRCHRVLEQAGIPDPRPYRVVVLSSTRTRSLRTSSGIVLEADALIAEWRGAIDTLLVAGGAGMETMAPDDPLPCWIARRARRIRRLGSVCTGTFALAQAGLLRGRKATTHWAWCGALAKRFPDVKVDADPIYIRDDNLYTSAGVTAGMDLTLALVEEDYGPTIALRIARELILYLRRPGTQSQFSVPLASQFSDRAPIRELQAWLAVNWHLPLRMNALAQRAGMSARHFARVFAIETGVTPASYVERLRVNGVCLRLCESSQNLDRVALDCGYASADVMRHAFFRVMRVNPEDYRARFRAIAPRATACHFPHRARNNAG